MKKTIWICSMLILLLLLAGCNKNKNESEKVAATATPSPKPILTLPPKNVTDEDNSGANAQEKPEAFKIEDYYPIQADSEYTYEGKGNEYASYTRFTDYIDPVNNKVQQRTNNGGTETVDVVQVKDGKILLLQRVQECYYRDNFLGNSADGSDAEILLMEPLVEGTSWTLPNGNRRYISATDIKTDTPSGSYQAIEVTTEEAEGGVTKDYYAPKVGLVKSIYEFEKMKVSSLLDKIKTDTPFTQTITVFHPDQDEKLHTVPLTLSFRTGDITRQILQDALRQEAAKNTYLPLLSENTKINSLYLGSDNIVYVDFSSDLVKEMNAGAGFETLILQGITNTLGNYYGSEQVYITIDGQPYSSGHILMKKGETFKVNTDSTVYE
jgi:Sporulation and spore germination.